MSKMVCQIETKATCAKPFKSEEWVEAPVRIYFTVSVMINLIFFLCELFKKYPSNTRDK